MLTLTLSQVKQEFNKLQAAWPAHITDPFLPFSSVLAYSVGVCLSELVMQYHIPYRIYADPSVNFYILNIENESPPFT